MVLAYQESLDTLPAAVIIIMVVLILILIILSSCTTHISLLTKAVGYRRPAVIHGGRIIIATFC
jgi:hypothetical protein